MDIGVLKKGKLEEYSWQLESFKHSLLNDIHCCFLPIVNNLLVNIEEGNIEELEDFIRQARFQAKETKKIVTGYKNIMELKK